MTLVGQLFDQLDELFEEPAGRGLGLHRLG